MIVWRSLAVFLGLLLMGGELYRSWCIGIPLVVTALLMAKDTFARRAAFAGAWGATAGMLYPSFFGKLVEPTPDAVATTNIPFDQLTVIIGVIFALSLAGLVASVALKQGAKE